MHKHVSRWKGLYAHSVPHTPDLQTVNPWVTVTQHKGDCACPQHRGCTFSSQPRGLPVSQAIAAMEPPALAATGSGAARPELGLLETLWKVPTAAGCSGESSTSLPSVSPKPLSTWPDPPRGPSDPRTRCPRPGSRSKCCFLFMGTSSHDPLGSKAVVFPTSRKAAVRSCRGGREGCSFHRETWTDSHRDTDTHHRLRGSRLALGAESCRKQGLPCPKRSISRCLYSKKQEGAVWAVF